MIEKEFRRGGLFVWVKKNILNEGVVRNAVRKESWLKPHESVTQAICMRRTKAIQRRQKIGVRRSKKRIGAIPGKVEIKCWTHCHCLQVGYFDLLVNFIYKVFPTIEG